MKLYLYDHCPFCVRARMPFGLKDIPVEEVFLPNDDEETPIGMIGQKMLPILEQGGRYIGESLDIVAKVDGLSGTRLFKGEPNKALVDWLNKWDSTINGLVIPRTPDPVFPEFASQSARAYFTGKKERTFGDFDSLIDRTTEFKERLSVGVDELIPLLAELGAGNINDILLFPILRSLTILPELELPEAVAGYTLQMSERCHVPLVDDLRAKAKDAG